MRRLERVRVALSAAVAVLAVLGAPSAARAQACGPGPHWVDVCPTGVDVFPSAGVMTVDVFGFGTFTLNTIETVSVWRGNPVDQYIHPFEGPIGLIDGHLDVIPTELNLTGASTQLIGGAPVLLNAGDGVSNGVADNSRFSPGAIDQYPATLPECPPPVGTVGLNEQACSFFDVFFEISHPAFGTLHNIDPALAVGVEPLCSIDVFPRACPSPFAPVRPLTYRKVRGGFLLVDAAGVPRAQLVAFQHTPFIPEPATVGLLATGLVGVAGIGLRRRHRSA